MIQSFRDKWLSDFYSANKRSRNIPSDLEAALRRKLQLINIATCEADLKVPPGNRFEALTGNLNGWYSIRVNIKYRLIFQWDEGKAISLYLDPHTYK